jgi:transposase-like protein
VEDYPKTLMEFEKRFQSEEACRDYLVKMRWPDGIQCWHCDSKELWSMRRALYLCKKCRFQTSILAGTIFQDTKKPLRLWFRAMWYITSQKSGVSALGLQRVFGFGSYRTAWKWLHKLRGAMVRPDRDRLSGIVEVDEAYIGGVRPGKRGRGAAGKELVVVAVEKSGNRIGRIRLKRVPDASSDNLNKAIQEGVESNTKVCTDGWCGYNSVNQSGYAHRVVRQEADVGENLLPGVNLVVSLLKRWLLGTHQGAVETSHLDYYLDEFTFRFNRRTSRWRGKLFYRLMEQAVQAKLVTK